MAWVFDHAPTENVFEHAVLLAIANRCDDDGRGAFPSFATIARDARVHRHTAIRCVDALKARGILGVERGASKRSTNCYAIRADQSLPATSRSQPLVAPSNQSSRSQPLPQSLPGTSASSSQQPDPSIEPSSEPSTKRRDPASDFADAWNRITQLPIPRCRDLTSARRRHIRVRLTERPFAEWEQVMARIQASAFCRGENDRGWKASFDWLVESPDVAVKVLEGKYDGRTGRGSNGGGEPSGRHVPSADDTQKLLDERRRWREEAERNPVTRDRTPDRSSIRLAPNGNGRGAEVGVPPRSVSA